MKQYLTPEQTAKLIELGVEKPKMAAPALKWVDGVPTFVPRYTISELIEMLGFHLSSIYYIGIVWAVNAEGLEHRSEELIDALYEMIIRLKEEGVL